ncbi:MAG: guanitoxin biosynthesis MATE family efflux transporter GntT [Cyanobacteriota bacterium]|nr:guanitoxin biosynthesis MATE family efflux transporter GntT [Cyanobacteriota bacterium]
MNQIALKESNSLYYRFFRLTLINMLSTIMVPLAILVSLAFLGHLSEISHLAGVALAANIFECIYFIFNFLRMSTSGITAQSVGRGDREEMVLVLIRNSLIALGLSLLLLILQYPLRELAFAVLEGSPEVQASGIDYFNACILGAPGVLLNYVLIGWFIGREESGKVFAISAIGNLANILLNYLTIVRWNWASTGAGFSQALSQYMMLLVGLILCCQVVSRADLKSVAKNLWHLPAFKSTFSLNGHLFVFVLTTVFSLGFFFELSGAMGAMTLTENALIGQVFFLAMYANDGMALAAEALGGSFKGAGKIDSLRPLVNLVAIASLLMASTFSTVTVLFPQTVFGLLTDRAEVIETVKTYVSWLFPVLIFGNISTVLKGYLVGLTEGKILRNASFAAIVIGFAPLSVAAWYFQSNHLLWLSISMLFLIRTILLGIYVPRTWNSNNYATKNMALHN